VDQVRQMKMLQEENPDCGKRWNLWVRYLLLPPHIGDVRQSDQGHAYENRKIAAKQMVPISSNRNSQGQHSPFKETGLPPFQRERLEYIHGVLSLVGSFMILALSAAIGGAIRAELFRFLHQTQGVPPDRDPPSLDPASPG
jgi:hypothetical protein